MRGRGVVGRGSCRAPTRRHGRWPVVAVCALLLGAWCARPAVAAPDMPPPGYENTFYAFIYDAPLATDEDYAASRDALLARAASGPYARVGFTTYYPIDLPWTADLSSPVLWSPSRNHLEAILTRLEGDDLVYHVAAMLGMSRFFWMYEGAKREDRRNAQWFLDNLIVPPGVARARSPVDAWVTPSRYARKLRRHMEAKVRTFASMFVDLRAAYPDTLISASGDAEAELSEARIDESLPYDQQIITDYGPFSILEFRDWILRAGLYGAGGPFAGQGYKKKRGEDFAQGAAALTPENLARFNATFGTAFTSWSLEYFHWSLDAPIDDDPGAIPYRKYKKSKFAPLPATGGSHLAGGFDAPRGPADPGKKWWKMWLKFRQKLVANFARDVATWMTTTPGSNGAAALSPDRWYTHQIPADYLSGRFPGAPDPFRRLQTSASTLATGLVPASLGSPGLTILDRFEVGTFGPPGGYNRTSQYALAAIEAEQLPNWGIPEYAPSWHIDVAPDEDVDGIAAQWHRAYAAGAHMVGYTPWPHFAGSANGDALGVFVAEVSDAPRAPFYVPTAHDRFVEQLYADLLGRAPSASELLTGAAAVAGGSVPRPQLVADLSTSNEGRETVAALVRLSLGLLGRAPELPELADWMAILRAGTCASACWQQRRQTIVEALATTSEFQGRFGGADPTTEIFVTKLHESMLGRSPTATEQSSWVGLIARGPVTRVQVARSFVDGAEFRTLSAADTTVILTYLATLARLPTDHERDEWRTRRVTGLSRRGIAQAFLISPEYRARFAN